MAESRFSKEDYRDGLLRLMPRGRIWRRDPGSVLAALATGLGNALQRLDAAAQTLLVDAFPATTDQLLPEWEKSLGLPDPCAGQTPTIQQRRAQVLARFANTGGQNVAFLTTFAKNLGYDIEITQYTPFRVGQNTAGQALNSADWAYAWTVNSPQLTATFFRTGVSAVGEPLVVWGNDVLQCELIRVAPAHTTLLFAYH